MDEILVRDLSMNLQFEKRTVKLEFPEPTLLSLLVFNKLLKQEEYVAAIRTVIPSIDEKDFLSNPTGIILGFKKLVYGDQKEQTGKSMDEVSEDFLPSALDMMGHRYGILPTELIKKVTFNQLAICMK